MKYKNANDVLPKHLINELQKYISGEIVYVPKPAASHKKWGEISGGRKITQERNKTIRAQFRKHRNIHRLADEFGLSTESIKKIVYCKRSIPT